jgi:SOS-response transcriptional repressor LexA
LEGSCERSFLRLNYSRLHEVAMPEKHKLVLDFIKAYIKLHGVAPSYSVIAKGLSMKSKSNIHRIIHKLKDEGLVAVKPYQFNSIRVIDRSVREVASL